MFAEDISLGGGQNQKERKPSQEILTKKKLRVHQGQKSQSHLLQDVQ